MIQPYIDKLEALKDYIYLLACGKICDVKQMDLYKETGWWISRVDVCPPTFDKYLEIQYHNRHFKHQNIFD